MNEVPYVSLLDDIEPFLDKPLDELPDRLRGRLADVYGLGLTNYWNKQSAAQRQQCVDEYDLQRDPKRKSKIEYWEALGAKEEKSEQLKRKLELSNPQGKPSEIMVKADALTTITARLNYLKALRKPPPFAVADWGNLAIPEMTQSVANNVVVPVAFETASVKHTTKTQRRDSLTPVIEQAQRQCKNPTDTAEVWANLLVHAERKTPPLLGATEEGLQYLKGGAAAKFNREALSKRLARQAPTTAV